MTILLTGATGYLGKHLLAALLRQGEHVAVIVRPRGDALAERVTEILQPFALPGTCLAASQLTVLAGDVTEEHLGLSAADRQCLAQMGVDAVLHSAGLTRFDQHLAERINQHNRIGAEYAYRLALSLGAKSFHHVSTAFVAGETDAGRPFASSDLDVGQRFRNPYEASKCAAEIFLREAYARDGLPINIYRPSIVVGGVPPIGKGQSTSTVYAFLKAGHFLKTATLRDLKRGAGSFASCGAEMLADGRLHLPLRIAADASVQQNLVSADYVAAATLAGLRHGASGVTVYPQLGLRQVAIGEMEACFADILGVTGVRLLPEDALQDPPLSFVEQCFARATETYRPYLFSGSDFAVEPTPEGFPDPADYPVNLTEIAQGFLAAMEPAPVAEKRGKTLTQLALDALAISGPEDYFDRLVDGQIGRPFLRRVALMDAMIEFAIEDTPPFQRTIHFSAGQASYSSVISGTRPDCTFSMSRALFDAVVQGSVDLRKAFFTGGVRLAGSARVGLKFGFLLGQYLRQGDARVIEEMTS